MCVFVLVPIFSMKRVITMYFCSNDTRYLSCVQISNQFVRQKLLIGHQFQWQMWCGISSACNRFLRIPEVSRQEKGILNLLWYESINLIGYWEHPISSPRTPFASLLFHPISSIVGLFKDRIPVKLSRPFWTFQSVPLNTTKHRQNLEWRKSSFISF